MTTPTAPLIAVIEDEEHLAQGLIFNLEAEGYRTHHEADGNAALAWLLDCAPYVVPIPGTRSIRRLKENALAVAVRLPEAQFERLYGILREQPVAGARVAAAWMATIDA